MSLEILTRSIVLVSTLLAGVSYAWFVSVTAPALGWTAVGAFLISFALCRWAWHAGIAVPLLGAYTAPALFLLLVARADYQQLLVWLALLAGAVFAGTDWRRWHTPRPWLWPLALWVLVLAMTWPVVVLREIDFSLVAATTLDTPNALRGGSPPLTGAWILSVVFGQLLGLLWLDLLWQRFGAHGVQRAQRWVCLPLIIGAAISAAAGVYQEYVDINWLNVGDWPSLDRATGLLLDANSMGTAAAVWAPLALVLVWQRGPRAAAALGLAALLACGVWASGSRTAFLILVVGGVALGSALVRQARSWQLRALPLALLLAAGGIVVAAAFATDDPTNPLARLVATLPRAETGGVATVARELYDRNGYGRAAALAFSEHPWTGLGIGAFHVLLPNYSWLTAGIALPPDNAQNWWRQQLVELGVIGALGSIAFSLLLCRLLVRSAPIERGALTVRVLKGALIGVGFASLLGVATQHPALFLTFTTLAYWLTALAAAPVAASSLPRGAGDFSPRFWALSPTVAWCVVLGCAAVVGVGQGLSARSELRVPARAARVGSLYSYGFSIGDTADGPAVRWAARDAVVVFAAEHAYFEVSAVTPHADAAANPVRVRLWHGDQLIADEQSSGPAPITRLFAVRPTERFVRVEAKASRQVAPGKALKISGRWLRTPPTTPPPAMVR